jgi:hypothetical protein
MSAKSKDVVMHVDGVKITQCAYRGPRHSEVTFPIDKSRYTVWTQTARRYQSGAGACQGTIERIV